MTKMIQGYVNSCCLVRERISELNARLNELRHSGNEEEIVSLDLERRIALLYTEHRQMQEIIMHLNGYMRGTEKNVETNELL